MTGSKTDHLHVIDWGLACQGPAWAEVALLIPRLIAAGHTPAEAEALAARVPTWKAAPETAVTGLAAVWSLFREFVARNGPQHIRASRARAADAGRARVEYRTRWCGDHKRSPAWSPSPGLRTTPPAVSFTPYPGTLPTLRGQHTRLPVVRVVPPQIRLQLPPAEL